MQGRRSILLEKNNKMGWFGDLVLVFVLKDEFDNKRKYTRLKHCQTLRDLELGEMLGREVLILICLYHF